MCLLDLPEFPCRKVIVALLLGAGRSFGQAEDKEPVAVVEIGGAGEWGLNGGSNFGPSLAVEVTPIEHWLELEAGEPVEKPLIPSPARRFSISCSGRGQSEDSVGIWSQAVDRALAAATNNRLV
jgi:hypothetical protein